MNQATASKPRVRLASKPRTTHPNHHLVNNNGIWWCQITVHHGPFSKRLRFSLETRELGQARRKRDRIFATSRPNPQAA
ncbi:MAG: hypothetical protein OSB65_19955 [Roseibacillus sp.]|nr:hypothetical protein [Roseibacillus sp.]